MSVSVLFAQASTEFMAPLLQAGIPGVVLAWFMIRSEARFRGMEKAVNRMSRSVLLLVVSMDSSNHAVRAEANELLEEINAANRKDRD